MTESDALARLAPDLNNTAPRSPRALLAGYVVAARTLDKCRAALAGTNGEYHFDCPLDNFFFGFAGFGADAFKEFVGTGADDAAAEEWIAANATPRDRVEIVTWNNSMRDKWISEMPPELQLFLEDYIPSVIPAARRHEVRCWFDVYDLEEGRM